MGQKITALASGVREANAVVARQADASSQ